MKEFILTARKLYPGRISDQRLRWLWQGMVVYYGLRRVPSFKKFKELINA